MTFGLRKAHKYIWLALVLIIPIIIIFSIKDLAVFSSEKEDVSQIEYSENKNIASFENDIIRASFSENQIEVILKTSLKNSSSVVYAIDAKGNKFEVIGQLTTAGVYTFKSNTRPKGIIISDDLKNVQITKLMFK
jgi:hypothetical protein